jgi:hypothetical protein
VPRPESQELASIDDIAAALSEARSAVRVLALRRRMDLTAEDRQELRRILAACDRIHAYHLALRHTLSASYQNGKE